MRNGSPSIKIWKMDTFLEQNELNRLKMVRFKYRWHRDPCMSFNFEEFCSCCFLSFHFLISRPFSRRPNLPATAVLLLNRLFCVLFVSSAAAWL